MSAFTLICFSHLRWDFVFQRPQQLLTRCAARGNRVIFVEEPEFHTGPTRLEVSQREPGVELLVPHLAESDHAQASSAVQGLLEQYFSTPAPNPVLWYYTPAALEFSRTLAARAVIFDCMDELSAFAFAPPRLKRWEAELMSRADLVFTGGQSLYEAKKDLHARVFAFPSSVDLSHFGQARQALPEPQDMAGLSHPRAGWFGVIDERMDLELLQQTAERLPDWQFVMVGPVVKIDPTSLPEGANLHYLGGKSYAQLPAYLAHWDAAIMPFARNASTRFISPTKTPEYLAGGKPVVSTSIRDVISPYGELGLVRIADTPEAFSLALRDSLLDHRPTFLSRADHYLSNLSWDLTWQQMEQLIEQVLCPAPVLKGF